MNVSTTETVENNERRRTCNWINSQQSDQRRVSSQYYSAGRNELNCISSCSRRTSSLNIENWWLLIKTLTVFWKEGIIHLEHYPRVARQSGEGRMYDTVRRECCWTHNSSDVYRPIGSRAQCVRSWKRLKRNQHQQWFLRCGALKCTAMKILDALPRALHGNLFEILIIGRY